MQIIIENYNDYKEFHYKIVKEILNYNKYEDINPE
jgi:hypothetical protein